MTTTTFTTDRAEYHVERELARGGTGVTYLVRRATDDERLVLKELRLELVGDWKSLELFEREIAALRALDHPGIPRYVDAVVDEEEGRFALVQTLVEGRTLKQIVDAGESFSAGEFERYLRQCLEVLGYLHGRVPPVIHRDITPANVMVCGERAHLIDFGSVKVALRDSTRMTSAGTFGYMAPEQILGRAEAASDLYGLGMTFIVAATGCDPSRLPVDKETGRVQADGVLKVAEPVRSTLLEMIRPGVSDRMGSAAEALARLDAPPAPEPRPRPPSRLWRWTRRSLLLLAAGLVLTLGVGWLTTLSKAEGEVRTLGGWFSGHGNPLTAAQATILGDIYALRGATVDALAFSPDGKRLASRSHDELLIWDPDSGALTGRTRARGVLGWSHEWVAFSRDGRRLASADSDSVFYSHDPHFGELQRRRSASAFIHEAFSTHRRPRLLSATHGEGGAVLAAFIYSREVGERRWIVVLGVVDVVGRRVLLNVEPGWTNVTSAAFSADGKRLAVVGVRRMGPGRDRYENEVVVWELAAGERVATFRRPGQRLREVALDPRGRRMAITGYPGISLWDVPGGKVDQIITDYDYYAPLVFGPRGQRLAIAARATVRVFDARSGHTLATFEGHDCRVQSLAFSPDGRTLATGSRDQTIKLWRLPR